MSAQNPSRRRLTQTGACIFDLYGTLVDIHTDENQPSLWQRMAGFAASQGARYEAEELRRAYLRLAAPPPPFAPADLGWGAAAVAAASAAWTAFGTMAAAAARRESSAGAVTLAFSLSTAALLAERFPGLRAGELSGMLDFVDFARGTGDTRPIVLALTTAAFFLFCAVRILESRRWASS